MRMFLVPAAALFVLFGAYSPASAAAAPALAKQPVYGQAHALVEKAGWRHRRWRRRWRRGWYGPRVYGYRYRRRRWRRGWYGPRVYGYRYRRRRWRRRRWWW
ncbi:MAG: hypothetical protein ACR2OF_04660 [Hyphomicrobium sp.]